MPDRLGSEPQESTSLTSPAFSMGTPIPGFIFTQTQGIKLGSSCLQDEHFVDSAVSAALNDFLYMCENETH